MSRLSTDLYAHSGMYEPYSEMEMRVLKFADRARELEDKVRKPHQCLDGLEDDDRAVYRDHLTEVLADAIPKLKKKRSFWREAFHPEANDET